MVFRYCHANKQDDNRVKIYACRNATKFHAIHEITKMMIPSYSKGAKNKD